MTLDLQNTDTIKAALKIVNVKVVEPAIAKVVEQTSSFNRLRSFLFVNVEDAHVTVSPFRGYGTTHLKYGTGSFILSRSSSRYCAVHQCKSRREMSEAMPIQLIHVAKSRLKESSTNISFYVDKEKAYEVNFLPAVKTQPRDSVSLSNLSATCNIVDDYKFNCKICFKQTSISCNLDNQCRDK